MTMIVNYIGVFKRGARTNLDKYYDRPWDVFESYYEFSEGWLPDSWEKKFAPSKQMDWGSWLYVCNRKQIREIVAKKVKMVHPVVPGKKAGDHAKTLRPIPLEDIPKRKWYGILTAEIY